MRWLADGVVARGRALTGFQELAHQRRYPFGMAPGQGEVASRDEAAIRAVLARPV
ncbi:hypothetical protein [Rhodanobacter terrae]|uniref:Uncharacterized protein n=1 Tax=Rhodanobacter terrae TaxID=418647 RepID=A0ABW0T2S8_9GAMM